MRESGGSSVAAAEREQPALLVGELVVRALAALLDDLALRELALLRELVQGQPVGAVGGAAVRAARAEEGLRADVLLDGGLVLDDVVDLVVLVVDLEPLVGVRDDLGLERVVARDRGVLDFLLEAEVRLAAVLAELLGDAEDLFEVERVALRDVVEVLRLGVEAQVDIPIEEVLEALVDLDLALLLGAEERKALDDERRELLEELLLDEFLVAEEQQRVDDHDEVLQHPQVALALQDELRMVLQNVEEGLRRADAVQLRDQVDEVLELLLLGGVVAVLRPLLDARDEVLLELEELVSVLLAYVFELVANFQADYLESLRVEGGRR